MDWALGPSRDNGAAEGFVHALLQGMAVVVRLLKLEGPSRIQRRDGIEEASEFRSSGLEKKNAELRACRASRLE